ncbi:MAG: hypothetical protein ACRDA4_04630 [Filifactoraceae bacterium]
MSTNCACTFSNKGLLNYSYTVNGVTKTDGNTESNIVSTCIKTDCLCLFKNQAYLNYSYTINGIKKTDGTIQSNIVSTCIKTSIASISVVKYVTITNIKPGDTFDYTVVVTNTGKAPLNNLKLSDALDSSIEYIQKSSKVLINTAYAIVTDNSTVSNIDIIVRSPIPSGVSSIFTFKVKVKNTAISNTHIVNKGFITSNEITTPIETNEVVVYIQYASLIINKKANKENIECNGELTYTFTIENNGNIDAINVVFKDYFEDEFDFDINNVIVPKDATVNKISEYNGINIIIPKIAANGIINITIPGIIKCCDHC